MDILKKSLAPITDGAWGELKEQTNKFLNIYLTGRIFQVHSPEAVRILSDK